MTRTKDEPESKKSKKTFNQDGTQEITLRHVIVIVA